MLRFLPNLVLKAIELIRHIFAKFGSVLRPIERLVVYQQKGSGCVAGNVLHFSIVGLHVDHNPITTEYHSERLQAGVTGRAGRELVQFVVIQRCDMAAENGGEVEGERVLVVKSYDVEYGLSEKHSTLLVSAS
jgi:hypothetical protein